MNDLLGSFRAGVALDLMVLAQLHDRELGEEDIARLRKERFPQTLAFRLESDQALETITMLSEVVAKLPSDENGIDELAADFAAIYLTHAVGASPCESVWLDDDGLAMQQPMFEVRESYARAGVSAPDWRKRSDDHLVHQLQFLSLLFESDTGPALSDAATFLDEHTLRWVPDFARRVAQRAGTPFYAGLAMLTLDYLDELRDVLAQILSEPRPTAEEVAERMKRPVGEEAPPMPSHYLPGSSPSW